MRPMRGGILSLPLLSPSQTILFASSRPACQRIRMPAQQQLSHHTRSMSEWRKGDNVLPSQHSARSRTAGAGALCAAANSRDSAPASPPPPPSSSSGQDAGGQLPSRLAPQRFPRVDEGGRSGQWRQKPGVDVDHRPLWGTFLKAVALVTLWFGALPERLQNLPRSIIASSGVLRELTYPEPREVLRLTLIVLLCSALLTALVWGIDTTFASVLLPPVVRKMAGGALTQ